MNKKEQDFFKQLLWQIKIFYKTIKPWKIKSIPEGWETEEFVKGYNFALKDTAKRYRKFMINFNKVFK